MTQYPTFDDFEEEHFRTHPEAIDPFLDEIFESYNEHRDLGALLASLRIIARVRGISEIAAAAGISRQGLQKALSAKGNPRLDTLGLILGGMGYRLAVKPLHTPRP
ncbi:MAG: addiction module antidote protein [Alphaproteobacteria bacterium]